jgi:hypothetical protein
MSLLTVACGGAGGSAGGKYQTQNVNTPPADQSDQFAGQLIQSIGTSSDALINNSAGDLSISGNIATLDDYTSSTMSSLNIGVGDVIVYGSNYAIIKGLSYNSVGVKAYVTLKDGSSAPTSASNSNFQIYHAFSSMSNWNSQTQNSNITPSIALSDKDLTDSDDEDGVLQVALYNDGAFAGGDVSSWTTNASNYIRLFAPYKSSQTFKRQRHQGIWSTDYVRLEVTGRHGVEVLIPHLRVEGLQCHLQATSSHRCIHSENNTGFSGAVFYFSHNVLRGSNDAGNNSNSHHSGIQLYNIGDGEIYIYNNVIYEFKGIAAYCAGIDFDDGQYTGVIANNTVLDSGFGIMNFVGSETIAKNNIAVNNTDNFYGTWNATSSNNISSAADAPGTSSVNSVTMQFANSGGYNFALNANDTDAINAGADLSAYSDLSFSTDVTSGSRGSVWDIGAFSY